MDSSPKNLLTLMSFQTHTISFIFGTQMKKSEFSFPPLTATDLPLWHQKVHRDCKTNSYELSGLSKFSEETITLYHEQFQFYVIHKQSMHILDMINGTNEVHSHVSQQVW